MTTLQCTDQLTAIRSKTIRQHIVPYRGRCTKTLISSQGKQRSTQQTQGHWRSNEIGTLPRSPKAMRRYSHVLLIRNSTPLSPFFSETCVLTSLMQCSTSVIIILHTHLPYWAPLRALRRYRPSSLRSHTKFNTPRLLNNHQGSFTSTSLMMQQKHCWKVLAVQFEKNVL